jgi:hypothetical protein
MPPPIGAGIELGMLELDFRVRGQLRISYFGLVPELTGKGNGGWLMAQALALAWRKGVERVWVHTCTLDHPSALGFYRHHGFVRLQAHDRDLRRSARSPGSCPPTLRLTFPVWAPSADKRRRAAPLSADQANPPINA